MGILAALDGDVLRLPRCENLLATASKLLVVREVVHGFV